MNERPFNFVNPLDYWCAPNAATPDYVPAHRLEDFIAFGLLSSHLSREEISNEFEITPEAVVKLREGFIQCLEITASILPDVKRGEQVDSGSQGTGTTLYPPGWDRCRDADEAPNYMDLEWRLDMRDGDGAVCLVLSCTCKEGLGGDDLAIWVDSRCFNNRGRFRRLVAQARAVNRVPDGPEVGP